MGLKSQVNSIIIKRIYNYNTKYFLKLALVLYISKWLITWPKSLIYAQPLKKKKKKLFSYSLSQPLNNHLLNFSDALFNSILVLFFFFALKWTQNSEDFSSSRNTPLKQETGSQSNILTRLYTHFVFPHI